MYWITRLDALNNLSFFITVALIVALVVTGICYAVWISDHYVPANKEDPRPKHWRRYRQLLVIITLNILLFAFIKVLLPTTKEFAAIYLIPKTVNNEQIQKIPDNAAKLLNAKLEEWITDTTKKK
jgi:uncharacterized BrkB/YihY/UPF0761 family membrane protein